jgi:hypothetical protein
MNQNRITNIIERGGVEGWETVKNDSNLLNKYILGSRPGLFTEIIQLFIS